MAYRPIIVAVVLAAASPVGAQSTDRAGRYSMAPADGGGFARLDTETGAMAICQRSGSEWVCRDMQDNSRQLLVERDKLAAENKHLKDELKRLEDIVAANSGRGPEPKLNLPTEEDVDKALSYLDRMLKKFREKLKELEGNRNAVPL
jgi:hypothetical protein